MKIKKVNTVKLRKAIKKSPKIIQEYIKDLKKLTKAANVLVSKLEAELNYYYWHDD